MARIKVIHNKDLLTGDDSNDVVYPITSAKAVYTTDNKKIQDVVQDLKKDIDNISLANNPVFLEESEENTALEDFEPNTIYYIYEPIEYTLVDKPVDMTFYADGTVHVVPDNIAYKVIGSGGSEVGLYTFIIQLRTAYKWTDGTRDNINVTYNVIEKPEDIWKFGDKFPIGFSGTWYFDKNFPIIFS